MTGRTLPGLLMASLAAFAGGGCSSSDSTSTDTEGPSGNPTLTILSVNGIGGTPDCIEVADGPDPLIPIEVSTTYKIKDKIVNTLLLRPPGYCGVLEETQCGHLVALVNGDENSTSATHVIVVHLGKLANHYADLTIAIEALDDAGKPILTPGESGTKVPLVKTAKVKTSKSCPKPADGGTDGG